MKLRFTQDAKIQLGYADGRVVSIAHRQGDEAEVPEDIGHLFLEQGVAVAVKRPQRAVKPKGEVRAR